MKNIFLLLVLFLPLNLSAQSLYFPPATASTWDTLSATSLGWCPNYLDTLDDYLLSENTDAFILLKDGKIVHEKYFGTFTADSSHTWNSAGKTMTAFAVGLAQQENLLHINDKTSDYLGNGWTIAPQVKEDLIKIKHQLSMSTGLDDGLINLYCSDDTCLNYLTDAGTRWAYHNGPYTLLQDVIQSATGSTVSVYLNQKLYGTTGITGTFFPIGYNRLFISKPRSMARFGLLMLNKGNWNGTQILTDTTYYNQMITPSQSLNNAYGYLWWLNGQNSFMLPGSQMVFPGKLIPNSPDDTYAALGKNDQLLVISPSKNIVFIRMGNSGNSQVVGTSMSNEIWGILNKLMCTPNAIDNIIENDIQLYPNPTMNELTVASNVVLKNASIRIINQLGQTVSRQTDLHGTKFRIDMSVQTAGLYILELEENGRVRRIKFAKK